MTVCKAKQKRLADCLSDRSPYTAQLWNLPVKIGDNAWEDVDVVRHDSLSKPTLQGTLGVGDAVDGRRNCGWTTSKRRHVATHVRTAHSGLPHKRLDEDLC